jgi:hypothetical protein
MTCGDIIDFATETTGDISSEALAYARKALKLKYATLYDSHNWRESMRVSEGQLDPLLNGIYFLPFDAEEVIFLSLSYDGLSFKRLVYRERDWIERFSTPAFNIPGNVPWFYRAENLAWPYINPGSISFTSAEPNPVSVYISGLNTNGDPVHESFVLQGTLSGSVYLPSGVTTANSYKLVTTISKNVCSTPMRVSDGTRTIVIPGATTELMFTKLILYPTPIFPNTTNTIYLRTQAKLKPDALDNDMSVPRISHIWEALGCFVKAAGWERIS